ncbi:MULTISPECIES: hypothetical protein [unclassified Okeania]|uniref:hypothetical protein n=1 Tax=unclassified Okeania TaxID=2634635 RepID=UPI0013F93B2B|nr:MULTISPECIES: hypothetical protein [unclassified Okeania]NET30148.1 hypothetical protein [Okeania sp. SIO1I7]GGA02376.1 hypothetical protein CYANOKiyG1_14420 [Okeania sp. KiyG1]
MPNRNPKPKDSAFHKNKRIAQTNRPLKPLAKKAISVKLEVDIDTYLRSLPVKERTILIREAITSAVVEHMKRKRIPTDETANNLPEDI